MMTRHGSLTVNLVDVAARRITFAALSWHDGVIHRIDHLGKERQGEPYLIPGFIDAHVHIESSMLTPAEFGRQAVRHGTVATLSDPHEIANVLGIDGVRYMLESAQHSPCKLFFGVPSCVPATPFESAGASLGVEQMRALFDEPQVVALSEMMNYPGVLGGDEGVMAKLALARELGYPIDGHAPGLRGEALGRYVAAGIATDHECFTLEEAQEKIAAGMVVQIREGSAARNFEALHPLITSHPEQVMLCSDDKHPDDLLAGHIDRLVARAVAKGHDHFDVLRCACLNPIRHYHLPLGTLQQGEPMDAVLVTDLQAFQPQATWVAGVKVAEAGRCLVEAPVAVARNRFAASAIVPEMLALPGAGVERIRVIVAQDGELVTGELQRPPRVIAGVMEPDPDEDVLLLMVLNRYQAAPPALAFVRGFGLRRGALASTVAHDSHNIIAVGCSREEIARAVNALVESGGGIALCEGETLQSLALPVAGLMSLEPGEVVARRYGEIDRAAKGLGSTLRAPYMTLSFMALLVIPQLKLSDRGLFDGGRFEFVPLVVAAANE